MALLSTLLTLVIPVECIRCSAPDEILCTRCLASIDHSLTPRVFPLSQHLKIQGDLRLVSCLPYNEEISHIVLGAKDGGNVLLQKVLVRSLVCARSYFSDEVLIVPIPSRASAQRKRGRDFTNDVARAVARITGDRVAPILGVTRKSAPQKSLRAKSRAINMDGALEVKAERVRAFSHLLNHLPTLVLDDVVTTGATIREGIRALESGGARCLGGISAAFSLNWSASQPPH